ncbi:MAG: hypothetical protein U1E85_02590 [Rhodocyclaceae bacterium]
MESELFVLIALGGVAVWILFVVARYTKQRTTPPIQEQEKQLFGKPLDHSNRMLMASMIPRVVSGRDAVLFVVLSLAVAIIAKLLGIWP